jgi:hypothetical protein
MPVRSIPDFAALIPELSAWNGGAGIDPESWISCVGNYELATGYSLIFWPSFVSFDGYVLREGFSQESLRGFERATTGDRMAVEAVMNHVHIADIHCNVEPTEGQLRYLGRVLKDIHEVKLRRDFPGIRFAVSFNDEAGLDPTDYELTFWQAAE